MRFFEDLYATYPRPYGDGPSPVVTALAKVLEQGSKVLDMGCGSGRDCIYLAKQGMEVWGIDSSNRGLLAAGSWAREEDLDIRFMNKDLLDNGLAKDAFDAIILVNTLEYGEDLRWMTRVGHEVYRLSNEGAYLALMVRSTDDTDLHMGKMIRENTREIVPGLSIHFFTDREIKAIFPDFDSEQIEEITLKEYLPKPTDHRYWVLLGERP